MSGYWFALHRASLYTIIWLIATLVTPPSLGRVWAAEESVSTATRLRWAPDAIFIKTGLAEKTGAVSVGVDWDKSDWLFSPLADYIKLSIDLEIGHWQTFQSNSAATEFTQFGLTPMLRLPFADSGRCQWFVEGGVGFHFIVPLYKFGDKKFGTTFNFQDLIGIGARFGKERHHELALYVSHFSNGDIHQPNPGDNFLQLRYLRHFD